MVSRSRNVVPLFITLLGLVALAWPAYSAAMPGGVHSSQSTFSAKVNFQPASASVPAGYVADGGAVYANRGNGLSYGWNADNSAQTRDRNAANSPDQRYDTLTHTQKPGNPNAVWEIAVPNGSYTVRVVAGDALHYDSVFKINVEGVLVVNGTPTSASRWVEGNATINVADGRLTIGNASGAGNNKLNFVDIASAAAQPTATRTPTRTPTSTTTATRTPTRTPTTTPLPSQSPTVGGCPVFPADSVWNTPITNLPVDANSSAYINSIGAATGLHPDFGAGLWDGGPIGIPYVVVPQTQPLVPVTFDYADESDPGPYPIPPGAPIEGGPNSSGDRHVLVVQQGTCKLYETWSSYPNPDGSWSAGSGAVFDLRSNALRPAGWTSADAAGLPILPGLVRREEVVAGEIKHALRFTAPRTRRSYLWPARHFASSSTDPALPPMGQRFRLKAGFDISRFSPDTQVILRALKTYGMFLADNGSAWYISGAPNEGWNNDTLVSELKQVKGSDFEAVNEASLQVSPDSGQARQP